MSLIIHAKLACDGAGCERYTPEAMPGLALTEIGKTLRMLSGMGGWTTVKERDQMHDFCPEHSQILGLKHGGD